MDGQAAGEDMWSLLGLTARDQVVYRALLDHPDHDPRSLGRHLRLSAREVASACAHLSSLRLVRTVEGRVEALEPRAALTALARQRQAVLEQVSDVAQDLGTSFGAARLKADPASLFEVLRGRDEIVRRHIELVQAATTSIDVTAVPPFITGTDEATAAVIHSALRRGVRIRAVYDASALTDPLLYDVLAEGAAEGEETRLLPALTTRFVIIDSGTTMLPIVDEHDRSDPGAVVVSRSAITHALTQLFSRYWVAARPLTHDHGTADEPDAGLDRELLTLLANGLTDQVIAHRLQCSERTLRRRIAVLSTALSASTRFQLAVAATSRGYIGDR